MEKLSNLCITTLNGNGLLAQVHPVVRRAVGMKSRKEIFEETLSELDYFDFSNFIDVFPTLFNLHTKEFFFVLHKLINTWKRRKVQESFLPSNEINKFYYFEISEPIPEFQFVRMVLSFIITNRLAIFRNVQFLDNLWNSEFSSQMDKTEYYNRIAEFFPLVNLIRTNLRETDVIYTLDFLAEPKNSEYCVIDEPQYLLKNLEFILIMSKYVELYSDKLSYYTNRRDVQLLFTNIPPEARTVEMVEFFYNMEFNEYNPDLLDNIPLEVKSNLHFIKTVCSKAFKKSKRISDTLFPTEEIAWIYFEYGLASNFLKFPKNFTFFIYQKINENPNYGKDKIQNLIKMSEYTEIELLSEKWFRPKLFHYFPDGVKNFLDNTSPDEIIKIAQTITNVECINAAKKVLVEDYLENLPWMVWYFVDYFTTDEILTKSHRRFYDQFSDYLQVFEKWPKDEPIPKDVLEDMINKMWHSLDFQPCMRNDDKNHKITLLETIIEYLDKWPKEYNKLDFLIKIGRQCKRFSSTDVKILNWVSKNLGIFNFTDSNISKIISGNF